MPSRAVHPAERQLYNRTAAWAVLMLCLALLKHLFLAAKFLNEGTPSSAMLRRLPRFDLPALTSLGTPPAVGSAIALTVTSSPERLHLAGPPRPCICVCAQASGEAGSVAVAGLNPSIFESVRVLEPGRASGGKYFLGVSNLTFKQPNKAQHNAQCKQLLCLSHKRKSH